MVKYVVDKVCVDFLKTAFQGIQGKVGSGHGIDVECGRGTRECDVPGWVVVRVIQRVEKSADPFLESDVLGFFIREACGYFGVEESNLFVNGVVRFIFSVIGNHVCGSANALV